MKDLLNAYIAKQSKSYAAKWLTLPAEYVKALNKELEVFRATFNRRVVYFAALQEVSDSVCRHTSFGSG